MQIVTALMGLFLLSSAVIAKPALAQAPTAPEPPSYTVTLTGYNAVPAQTKDDPFVTASGAYSNPAVVAARSQDMAGELPFGTIVRIDEPPATSTTCGYGMVAPIVGYRIIADTMNVRYHHRMDILFSTKAHYATAGGTKNASTVLGVCPGATISVVGHVDISNIPKTQAALVALVAGRSGDLASVAQ